MGMTECYYQIQHLLPEKNWRGDEPKIDGDEPTPNVDDVGKDVDPKRPDEVDAPKGEELNAVLEDPKFKPPMLGVFGANGLEGTEVEKGLAAD